MRNEADMSGGEIKNILNYQYERDYLNKARENDMLYQDRKTKARLTLVGSRQFGGGDTLTSKKRMDSNQRKLKIIN
jgi:hypothetical protein